MAQHPGLIVELDLNDRYVDLASERHDMAVRIGRLTDSSLVARKLASSRVIVVASPDYLARRGTPMTPAELAGHDCLVYSNRTIADQWRIGDRVAAGLNPRVKANNGDAICAAAAAGLGLAVLPTFIAGPAVARGALRIILADVPYEDAGVYAVYLPSRHLSAKVRLLVDFLASHFGGRPYWDEGLFPTP
jgi:DNA-binding transcriptional LysR family regulator